MQTEPAKPADDAVQVSRAEAARLVHDLRNRLNSLLMSSGVLASGRNGDGRVARLAAQIERDGDGCSALLSELTDLLQPQKRDGGN